MNNYMKSLIRILAISLIMMVNACLFVNLYGQDTYKLLRSTPENEGVSSSQITDFLNAVDTGRVEFHSFMFIRHGKVIAEGWWIRMALIRSISCSQPVKHLQQQQ